MIRRRALIAATAFCAVGWLGRAFAQSKKSPVVIGWLGVGSPKTSQSLTRFKEGMAAAGWKEGSQFIVEERWAYSQTDQLPKLAQELVDISPAVIAAYPAVSVRVLAKLTSSIPIVQANGGDLVALGLAKSLARPGGNVTGVTNISREISEKHLELLLIASPQLRRVGFLADPGSTGSTAYRDYVQRAIAHFKVDARFAEVKRPEEIEPAIARLAKEGVQGLMIISSAWFGQERRQILSLALAHRWPVIGDMSAFATAGALLSYGTNRGAVFRRSAYYVDRILKGAKPGDLPIEQPTTFDLVVNLKTAKMLGITLPPEIMVRATPVIE